MPPWRAPRKGFINNLRNWVNYYNDHEYDSFIASGSHCLSRTCLILEMIFLNDSARTTVSAVLQLSDAIPSGKHIWVWNSCKGGCSVKIKFVGGNAMLIMTLQKCSNNHQQFLAYFCHKEL